GSALIGTYTPHKNPSNVPTIVLKVENALSVFTIITITTLNKLASSTDNNNMPTTLSNDVKLSHAPPVATIYISQPIKAIKENTRTTMNALSTSPIRIAGRDTGAANQSALAFVSVTLNARPNDVSVVVTAIIDNSPAISHSFTIVIICGVASVTCL